MGRSIKKAEKHNLKAKFMSVYSVLPLISETVCRAGSSWCHNGDKLRCVFCTFEMSQKLKKIPPKCHVPDAFLKLKISDCAIPGVDGAVPFVYLLQHQYFTIIIV